ncbi:hypothetical protein EVAR_37655_1 [Eumeta japonica]|uniref:Uncharacterized protein n=1 Tax=Eumeta variegata TaxID=151549 RepID=A0A4C1VNH6_EUMVA|nr:hypothetical protein EVAR_37655_1 [Eumeta japonica]
MQIKADEKFLQEKMPQLVLVAGPIKAQIQKKRSIVYREISYARCLEVNTCLKSKYIDLIKDVCYDVTTRARSPAGSSEAFPETNNDQLLGHCYTLMTSHVLEFTEELQTELTEWCYRLENKRRRVSRRKTEHMC